MTEQTTTPLSELITKYGSDARQRSNVTEILDRSRTSTQRVGTTPQTGSKDDTGKIAEEIAGIQLELADLATEYGGLTVEFKDLFGAQKIYKVKESLKLSYYQVTGNKKASQDIRKKAMTRHRGQLENLVDKIAGVFEQQRQKAIEGRNRAQALRLQSMADIRRPDKKIVTSMRNSYVGDASYAQEQQEVKKLEMELEDIQGTLETYEKKATDAKTGGDMDSVYKFTDEMLQVLEIKHRVLDGKLSTEGKVSDIRRKILDDSEAIQSVKGAVEMTYANYSLLNSLVDSMNEIEIKYRHAQEDMIPVFKTQAAIAVVGLSGAEMKEALTRTAALSSKLMDANERLIKALSTETFELLRTPIYDPVKARDARERIDAHYEEINALKMEWAEANKSVSTQPTEPHYSHHT